MSKRNQRRKRHPLVRFLRSVLRLIRALFKPNKRLARSIDRSSNFDLLPADFQQVSPELPIATAAISIVSTPEISPQDPLLETIGELFARVQWQMLPAPMPAKVAAPVPAVRTNLASPSGASLETVGELLDRVKWQLPTPTVREQVASTGRVVRTPDVSLN